MMIISMFISCSNSKNWRLSAPVYPYGAVFAEATDDYESYLNNFDPYYREKG